MQPGQRQRLPPVRLHPFVCPAWDQGRCHHEAITAQRLHLPIKTISRRAGLDADVNFRSRRFRDRHRVLQLCCTEGDIYLAMLPNGPSLLA